MQRYTNNIQTQTGQAIGGAIVTVLNFPSLSTATIYSDNNNTPLVNPVVTDSSGFFAFYAVNGRYSIAISGANIKPYQVDDLLSEDQLSLGTGSGTDAGTLTGAETVPTSRSSGLLQTTWSTVATFILSIFTLLIASGTGAVARTILAKLRDLPISPEDFGAVGDGIAYDTTQLQNALNASALIGVPVRGNKRYRIAGLNIPNRATYESGTQNFAEGFSTNYAYDTYPGTLLLDAAGTINLGEGGTLQNCAIVNSALSGNLPATTYSAALALIAAFAGTSITCSAASAPSGGDPKMSNLFILGFNTPISTINKERVWVENIKSDCTNGPSFTNMTDFSYFRNIECWPFLMAHSTLQGAHPDIALRLGFALQVLTESDGSTFDEFKAFGYQKGILISAPAITTFKNPMIDGNPAMLGTSVQGVTWQPVGFTVAGSADKIEVRGGSITAQYWGVNLNVSSGSAQVTLDGTRLYGNFADFALDSYKQLNLLGVALDYAAASGASSSVLFNPATRPAFAAAGASASAIGQTTVACIQGGTRSVFPASIDPGILARVNAGLNQFQAGNGTDTVMGERRSFDAQLAQLTNTVFGAAGAGMSLVHQYARGTSYAPAVTIDGDIAYRVRGQLYTGAAYGDSAMMRFQADGAASAGSTPGKIILSTTPTGSTGLVDRVVMSNAGHITPITDNALNFGAAGSRWANFYAVNATLTSMAAVLGAFTDTVNSSATLTVTNTGSNGANIKMVGNGATAPKKTIRVNSGALQVMNDAYSAPIMALDDSGNLTAAGGLSIAPATTTTAPSAGGGGALPATPTGYATITLGGTARKIAYY